jgi:hypothetical protein
MDRTLFSTCSKKFFCYPKCPHWLLFCGYWRAFHGGKSAWGAKQNTDLCLMQRLRMSGAEPLSPPLHEAQSMCFNMKKIRSVCTVCSLVSFDYCGKHVTLLFAFFWVISQRLNFICRRFGTLLNLYRQVGMKNDQVWEYWGIYTGKGLAQK